MIKEESALHLFDMFQWAMDEGYACISIKTFKTKFPEGYREQWQAFFFSKDYESKEFVTGNSIKDLYKKMETFMLTGKGAVKALITDEDLL